MVFFRIMQQPQAEEQEKEKAPPVYNFAQFEFNAPNFEYVPDKEFRKPAVPKIEPADLVMAPIPFDGRQDPSKDKSIVFDLTGLKLDDQTAGEIRVWQIRPGAGQELPLACKAEAYFNNNIFWGIHRRWKGTLYKEDYIKTFAKGVEREQVAKWGEERGKQEAAQIVAREVAIQKANSRALDLDMAFNAANQAYQMYADGLTREGVPLFDPRYEKREPIEAMLEKLYKLTKKPKVGSNTDLENINNILRYLTEFNFQALEDKLNERTGELETKNKHFIALMMTKDTCIPLYWYAFTLRTVQNETCMILHAVAKSLLQNVFVAYNPGVPTGSLRGPFSLSIILHVAALLNNKKHVPRVYLQAMTGTEIMLKTMREEMGGKSPYLKFIDQKLVSDRRFVDATPRDFRYNEIPDKIIVDVDLLNYWNRYTAENVKKAKAAKEAKESEAKRAKVSEMLAKYLV